MVVQGSCDSKFDELKKIFQDYFDKNEEIGANFSIVKNSNVLVNIFCGTKDKNNNKWDNETIVNTFSLSKGIYAGCVAKLIEKKYLDIDKKVSFYWPEFKIDKENIKVKHILSHRSGLFRFKTKISNDDLLDFEKITGLLEKQKPDHAPGEKTYYHAKTHGFLVENLIRKTTSLSLKDYFNFNFSKKFNLNFNFGFNSKDFENVADLYENNEEVTLRENGYNAFNNPQHEHNFYNSRKWRLAGVPSMGGHGSGLAVAKFYDILANDLKLNKKKIISKELFSKILEPVNSNIDYSLKLPIKWTNAGYILRGGWMFGKNKQSFGHNGWGGSLGFGDPIEGVGISYVTRKINPGMSADIRAVNLIKKAYEIFGKTI